jgi:hypothetical protein
VIKQQKPNDTELKLGYQYLHIKSRLNGMNAENKVKVEKAQKSQKVRRKNPTQRDRDRSGKKIAIDYTDFMKQVRHNWMQKKEANF